MTLTKRSLLVAAVLVAAVAAPLLVGAAQRGGQTLPAVTVYKDPNCGCCSLWVTHMERAGFRVTATNTADMPALRAKLGVAPHVQSCHTAVVDGFVVEGHVPADDVKRLLSSRPKVKGIAVPGMPIGSPGMEQGNVKHQYSVLTFDDAGRTTVFATH
jgi:hypothetical protein